MRDASVLRLWFVIVLGLGVAACASAHTQAGASVETPHAASAKPEPLPPSAAEPVSAAPQSAPAPEAAAVDSQAPAEAQAASAPTPTAAPAEDDPNRYVDVVTEQGQHAHGLYFNAPLAKKLGPKGIANMVLGAGLNAAVIDIKDSDGRIAYDTQVPDLQKSKHVFFKDAPAFIAALKERGVYTIARVVCFSDPILPIEFPDRAVLDDRPGHKGDVWVKDKKFRNPWLDPYNTKNHDVIVAIAKEVEQIGFDEVQLDYIRFPVDIATKWAVFPAQTDQPRVQVILELLRKIDEAIHIPLGADVFGVAAFNKGDSVPLLGQQLDMWAKHVEVFTPMLYVFGMKSWMRHKTVNRAGLLVQQGIKELRGRIGGAPVIRPFLQGFSNGADYYNPEFIAEQIRGARDGGADGFLFWNPGSTYTMVRAGMAGPGHSLIPFSLGTRAEERKQAWGEPKKADPQPSSAIANGAHVVKPAS